MEFCPDHCVTSERVAKMEQRLSYGDRVLEMLTAKLDSVVDKVNDIHMCVMGSKDVEGLIHRQKKHEDVIARLENLETITKVEKHHVWYILGCFLIGFFGVGTIAGIVAVFSLSAKITKVLAS